jgi:phospholipase D1/2
LTDPEPAVRPSDATARIVQIGRNAWREAHAEDSGILVDAASYYRALYWSIRRARRYVLMSGWQFDSKVELLRGSEVPPKGEVRLVKFLNACCEANPELQVYILAWDFHVVFAAEREWMQRVYFHWLTNTRLRFLFDECPVPQASHHQKFVVIDGTVSFVGGMDVCEARWDDRRHCGENALRTSRGRPSKPYHDVQAYLVGADATAPIEEIFWERWTRAGGERPALAPIAEASPPTRLADHVSIGPARVAFSRTDPCEDPAETVREVEGLLVDAISAAFRLIYVETQYFSSRKLCRALEERMRRSGGERLEIVVVVNERAEAVKEEIAVGLRQAQNLLHLAEVARATGHRLGVYYSVCEGPTEDFAATYVHSKVTLVDDRFLTVGSANFTNRSMGLDSELHVSWEANSSDEPLGRAIRKVRVSLLAEHAGISGIAAVRGLTGIEGLVAELGRIASRPDARLRKHGPPSAAQTAAMQVVDPEDLPFDPESSPGRLEYDEPVDENGPPLRTLLRAAARRLGQKLRR